MTSFLNTIDVNILKNQCDEVHSWMMGTNISDKKPHILNYFSSANNYCAALNQPVVAGRPDLEFEKLSA